MVLAGMDGGGFIAGEVIERLLAAQIALRNGRRRAVERGKPSYIDPQTGFPRLRRDRTRAPRDAPNAVVGNALAHPYLLVDLMLLDPAGCAPTIWVR